jgi:hypothetical protein
LVQRFGCRTSGKCAVWRIGNFQFGLTAGNININDSDWRRKWRI